MNIGRLACAISPGGYAYGSDLVAGLKARHDFEVSVSAYPELHPESGNWDTELDNLKRKIDAGATRAITQFFLSSDVYFRFLDRIEKAGIDIEITPGIMMQPKFSAVERMAKMCHVSVPQGYSDMFEGLDDDVATRKMLTASLIADMTGNLRDQGVNSFHLYTLNRFLRDGVLPAPDYPIIDTSGASEAIANAKSKLDGDHVVTQWLERLCQTLNSQVGLLQSRGTAEFAVHSTALFGEPTQLMIDRSTRVIDLANHMDVALDELDYEKLVVEGYGGDSHPRAQRRAIHPARRRSAFAA